jgi:peptidoglycan/LPS O-acetylase OafA/YrhL
MLERRWYLWLGAAVVTFILWMMSMAPVFYGYSNAVVDLAAYLAVVLAVASTCFCLAAVFLRFANARWAVSDSLAENAYTIYLVHYVFVVWLQYILLGVALPAIAKGLMVFSVALLLSWTVAAGWGWLGLRWPTQRGRPLIAEPGRPASP